MVVSCSACSSDKVSNEIISSGTICCISARETFCSLIIACTTSQSTSLKISDVCAENSSREIKSFVARSDCNYCAFKSESVERKSISIVYCGFCNQGPKTTRSIAMATIGVAREKMRRIFFFFCRDAIRS